MNKKKQQQTNKQNTPLQVFCKHVAQNQNSCCPDNVIIWSANHNIFYASNQHQIWKIVNSLSTFECMRTTKATNLNTMHVDSLKKSYQNHNAIKLTHIEHNRLFYPIVK